MYSKAQCSCDPGAHATLQFDMCSVGIALLSCAQLVLYIAVRFAHAPLFLRTSTARSSPLGPAPRRTHTSEFVDDAGHHLSMLPSLPNDLVVARATGAAIPAASHHASFPTSAVASAACAVACHMAQTPGAPLLQPKTRHRAPWRPTRPKKQARRAACERRRASKRKRRSPRRGVCWEARGRLRQGFNSSERWGQHSCGGSCTSVVAYMSMRGRLGYG